MPPPGIVSPFSNVQTPEGSCGPVASGCEDSPTVQDCAASAEAWPLAGDLPAADLTPDSWAPPDEWGMLLTNHSVRIPLSLPVPVACKDGRLSPHNCSWASSPVRCDSDGSGGTGGSGSDGSGTPVPTQASRQACALEQRSPLEQHRPAQRFREQADRALTAVGRALLDSSPLHPAGGLSSQHFDEAWAHAAGAGPELADVEPVQPSTTAAVVEEGPSSSSASTAESDDDDEDDSDSVGALAEAAQDSAMAESARIAAAAFTSGFDGFESSGFESAFEDELEPTRYCVNCTAALDSELCMDCGHLLGAEDTLFSPLPLTDEEPAARLPPAGDMMLVWDERMELHKEADGVVGSPHPERPDRVRAVVARLLASGLAGRCRRVPARPATAEEIERCHTNTLRHVVEATAHPETQGIVNFTPDTYTNRHTALAASLAAGASVDVAVAVATGQARSAAAIVRPPGHHAESGMAMGFCFYNNAAVAARAARAAGAARVLILDWDVHHGNGTAHILEDDPSIMYMSLHRYDDGSFYPGTGAPDEVGIGEGVGMTVNVAWNSEGMGDGDYLAAFHHVLLPIATQFAPSLIIASAGFDAAEGDPIGGCAVTSAGFAAMTAMLASVAPLAIILEGGYNLEATASGVEACLRVCLGERPPPLRPEGGAVPGPQPAALAAIHQTIAAQARYWSCLQGLLPWPAPAMPLHQPAATLQPLRAPSAALSDDWLLPVRSPHAAVPGASPSANPFGFSSGSGFSGRSAPAPHDRPTNRHRALHSISEAQLGGTAGDADLMNGGALCSEGHHPESGAPHHEQHQRRQQHQSDSRPNQKRQPNGSLLDRHTNGHHVGGSGSHSHHQNGGHSGRERAPPQSPKSPSAQARRTKLAFRSGQGRSARRWQFMQALHNASSKGFKRRSHPKHHPLRRASLSLEDDIAAQPQGLPHVSPPGRAHSS